MLFYADLHVHSRFSRATSRNCDLKHLAIWARKKGIGVVGTGDFTHPAWRAELKEQLVPAEPGLFRLRPDLERAVEAELPPACAGSLNPVRFMLSVEISTIYKKGDKTRKIHHLVYAPEFDAVDRLVAALTRIGNLHSDGRPILGLDSRHLLEMTLESGPGSYLVPAHVWTPWFAALGSKSGFDAVDDCYGDLAPHIFAVETGLSSDPPMNWRVSSLDRFRLMSNSDAHSPEKLGREVCVFDTGLDYFALRRALETGEGYGGTLEFFPEEGKYHLDGHRNCNVRLEPDETRRHQGRCPSCGKPLTVGVMHRVEDLADREVDAAPPATAGDTQGLIPLPEILGEILQVGPKSKRVAMDYESLLARLGPELQLLNSVPLEDISPVAPSPVAEAVARLRRREVIRDAGYDGVYGTIRLFRAVELAKRSRGAALFEQNTAGSKQPAGDSGPARSAQDNAAATVETAREPDSTAPASPDPRPFSTGSEPTSQPPGLHGNNASLGQLALPVNLFPGNRDLLAGLDAEQRAAAELLDGPLLIVAGPGSGKTRTLTHRLAHLVASRDVPPSGCLAVTFTRRAADEMRNRLRVLLPDTWAAIPLHTFHSLGLALLREHWNAAGLQRGFRVASEVERLQLLRDTLSVSERQARTHLSAISHAKRTRTPAGDKLAQAWEAYRQAMETRNWCDFDDLIIRAADTLEDHPDVRSQVRLRYPWVCIDEYQDVDEQQARLIKQLVPSDGNLCAIGDPDQAIYGFRGADVRFFTRFPEDFPSAQVVRLDRNYRSDRNIVTLSSQVMGSTSSAGPSIPVLDDAPNLVTLHEAPSEKAEAEFVVQSLEEALGGHSFFSLDSGRSTEAQGHDFSFSDFAVLYRTEAQAAALTEALARSGMPFQQRSHNPLSEHPGVAALVEALENDPAPGAGSVRERLERAHRAAQPPAADTLEALELLRPLTDACGEDLDRFLSELALGTQVDTWDPRADRISLLTLHAAKGLEFPVVFIVGCEHGLLPLTWGKPEPEDPAEERRLFYVGVTRAKTRLFLCRARKRRWRGKVREMPPSPYLADIEERLLEQTRSRPSITRARKRDDQLDLFS
ncbi:MAG: UvrD-helicase domain-containing protein [Deltaproteobacteria bacterium]|nr:UvrD-helicase domain-containing protein [Deltaproteobacteria bacterium]